MKTKKNCHPGGSRDPEQIQFEPSAVISQLNIQEGEIVADFGCGAGHFVIPIAKIVGDEGTVYAFDVLEKRLEAVSNSAKLNALYNIVAKKVNLEVKGGVGKILDEDRADKIIISDVLFANKDKNSIIAEASDNLKPGGELIIIDWKKDGPPTAPSRELLVSPKEVTKLCEENSLELKRGLNLGEDHWGRIFVKK